MYGVNVTCPICDGIVEVAQSTADGNIFCPKCHNHFHVSQCHIPENIIQDDEPEYDGNYPLDI